jgi:hypothetical protein
VKETLLSLLALTLTLASPAFSQKIIGYTSLGTYNGKGTYVQNAPNPVTNKIYANSSTGAAYTTTIDVISGTTHKIITSITANAGVAVLAVNPNTNTIYSMNQDATVTVIDGSVDQVVATIPALTSDTCINNMAIDDSANKLVVIDECGSTAYVLDGSSYALLATVNLLLQDGSAAAVNPVTHLLYIAGGYDHAYEVIDLTAYTDTEVSVSGSPCSVDVDTTYNRIYIGDGENDVLYEFNGAANTQVRTVALAANAYGLAVNQKTHILAVYEDNEEIYFFHDLNLTADGQVNFYPKYIQYLSANSTNNLFYVGVNPSNELAYIQGPTH